MSGDHNEKVREQFTLQASSFAAEGFATRGLDWLVERFAPRAGDQVLDVAAGAAHLGRALAPHVRHVHAADLTPGMLEQGRRLAAADGIRNITFVPADAVALPWPDGRFDLVVCRLALHQVADPAGVVREMVRVTRAGGRIGVADMIVDEDPVLAREANRLERLRDPSHNTTLTRTEITGLLAAAGAAITSSAVRDQHLDLADWMQRSATPPDAQAEIRRCVERELAGGEATGLRPALGSDGQIGFVHPWLAVVAARP